MVALLLLAACDRRLPSACDALRADPDAPAGRDVLVIVTDDIGVDRTGVYGEATEPTHTPNIDALAAAGVRFTNAYATPTCSPTRAALLTGRMPSRTGVGVWMYPETDEAQLELDEVTLPEVLDASPWPWARAAVGKWHLVAFTHGSPATNPQDQGFDCHAGPLGNPLDAVLPGHTPRGYDNWEKARDGQLSWEHHYLTADTTDEALARLAALPSPWFVYVAWSAAHEPLHVPPASLTPTAAPGPDPSDRELYEAMVESVDSEIGRLLAGVPDRDQTTVIYLSDNGSPSHARPAGGESTGKGTVYEGGVNVPFVVTGPYVGRPGSVSDALVHVVDVLPTVAEIAEVDLAAVTDADGAPLVLDGTSLLPVLADPDAPSPRPFVYTEGFGPNGPPPWPWRDRMVRDADWKLVREERGTSSHEELYRLEPGAEDGPDHLDGTALDAEEADALARLREAMDGYRAALPQ